MLPRYVVCQLLCNVGLFNRLWDNVVCFLHYNWIRSNRRPPKKREKGVCVSTPNLSLKQSKLQLPIQTTHIKVALPWQRKELGQIFRLDILTDRKRLVKLIRLAQFSIPQHLDARIKGSANCCFQRHLCQSRRLFFNRNVVEQSACTLALGSLWSRLCSTWLNDRIEAP